MNDFITLAHGSGGKLTHELIDNIFRKYFSNEILERGDDSAIFNLSRGRYAFTTDSFVITPVFFKGGDIGKLSVCGTVNDLVSNGAKPLYMSCSVIIEEGFKIEELESIVLSMAHTAKESGVKIVTGDTKVVQKGSADRIFINTTGIGVIPEDINISGRNARPGDRVIITGTLGDHETAILLERENLGFTANIKSDCAPLNMMMEKVFENCRDIHVLRDPTRGGLATTLNEIALDSSVGITLYENAVPVRDEVRGVCEFLGFDPFYMANEGKLIIILPEASVKPVMEALKNQSLGKDACVIGEVTSSPAKRVLVKTVTGGSRILDMLTGEQLPRIC
jgi:hydrogenase expression/formation protein HypE